MIAQYKRFLFFKCTSELNLIDIPIHRVFFNDSVP